ncbi:BMP family ABC transporter substrate-binding protein [Domibacillus epiphyticus]|uniref:BMP family ABC transporter substrate-binding protein n=1 Tax=Domibacillus epiphyticus TaxID=1714355 RepID=A0A1V2A7X7_9BACI|nr:BMP family ABC transporter substrate-binding protein [Domibacillus epiphyticus]OMP67103.1 BMP family ABC transporter substrate-binding protein [Domibacillus epiphyticus]
MMKKWISLFILTVILLMTGCSNETEKSEMTSAGMLITDTISDQVWGTKGYKGMLKIQSEYGVDVFYKERINSQALAERAVDELAHKGVNLIFGHGMEYAEYFNKIAPDYPNIHFVSFNGDAKRKNTTSLKFEGHAMGFFGGMTAAHASKTDTIAVIATFQWQPEVKGFNDGALYVNPDAKVITEYVNNWDDTETALAVLDKAIAAGADVIYPAGDGYNVPVIEKVKEHNLRAIGYVSDQSDLGRDTVLTSTVQHVDRLYSLVAGQYAEGSLDSGNVSFDFADNVISLSPFGESIDPEFAAKMDKLIDDYKKTGQLPGQ